MHTPSWLTRDILWLPLSELSTLFGFALALVLLAQVLRSNRPPQSTIAWLLTIILIPYIGVPLYLTLGGRKNLRMARRKAPVYTRHQFPAGGGAERILSSFGVPPASQGNRVELLTSGVDAYHALCRVIDSAQRTLHVTSYILGCDAVGEAIVARLALRASEGVEVRVLLDDLGSWRVRRKFLDPLVKAGGRAAFFMPVIHWPFRGRSNLRNHRKIVVADGVLAITGGMNLAHEYLGPTPDPDRWRDVSLVVEGPAAFDLESLFWSDWTFTTGEVLPESRERPTASAAPEGTTTRVQVVASGPDVQGDPLYESLISLLFAAQERIWVVTPYFVPDEILSRALELAARRGVDVRIVIPHRSNHLSADLARVGYLRQIEQAGGKILRYKPVMVHAKVVIVDRELAVVGSANMDMRSLFLNYEVALFLFSRERVAEAEQWLEALMSRCKPGLTPVSWPREIAENVVRLLSPLL